MAALCTLLVIALWRIVNDDASTRSRASVAANWPPRCARAAGALATAESCTGGLIAAACTDLAGSSDWFERGFVSYSNEAKTALLGVPAALIAAARRGQRSGGARDGRPACSARSGVDLAVAVTGIAGPGGGTPSKPVGTVWFGFALRRSDGTVQADSEHRRFDGDRAAGAPATRASTRCAACCSACAR